MFLEETKESLKMTYKTAEEVLNAYVSGERAFRGVNLRGADLQGVNLREADLREAYLRGADLWGADLWGADLREAYLRGADLRGADLRGADLRGADLRGAYLQGAYLQGANLREADLEEADLWGAYLEGADLWGADLRGADLEEANLREANLQGANLQGANLPDLTSAVLTIVPEGDIVGYKKLRNECIAKLRIPSHARRSNGTTRKCRAEEALVLEITDSQGNSYPNGFSLWNSSFEYVVGKNVRSDSWCEDRWVECAPGIHFFLTRAEAEAYNL